MGETPVFQVDAFAEEPFSGNPAAVCLLEAPAEPEWMQAVAAEMNLSETAFVHPHEGEWDLRWFTPAVEVELCGHATLAAAHVLWETGRVAPGEPVHFHTFSGRLLAARPADGEGVRIDLPADPPQPVETDEALTGALGVTALAQGKGRLYDLVEVASEAEVRGARPDVPALLAACPTGVVLTSRGDDSGVEVVSRFFAPALGVDEDPVTGSAHCLLGPWWSERLGRASFEAAQISSRGGRLRVETEGERVRLTGQAVTVLRGTLCG